MGQLDSNVQSPTTLIPQLRLRSSDKVNDCKAPTLRRQRGGRAGHVRGGALHVESS
jgi:hypothetical protein